MIEISDSDRLILHAQLEQHVITEWRTHSQRQRSMNYEGCPNEQRI